MWISPEKPVRESKSMSIASMACLEFLERKSIQNKSCTWLELYKDAIRFHLNHTSPPAGEVDRLCEVWSKQMLSLCNCILNDYKNECWQWECKKEETNWLCTAVELLKLIEVRQVGAAFSISACETKLLLWHHRRTLQESSQNSRWYLTLLLMSQTLHPKHNTIKQYANGNYLLI